MDYKKQNPYLHYALHDAQLQQSRYDDAKSMLCAVLLLRRHKQMHRKLSCVCTAAVACAARK